MARKNLLKGFKKPKGLEFDRQESTESYGKFTASPFETGFGTTIGNCLRRILLSSIQGYAISAVLITSYDADGVPHTISSEFENIPNVSEDTLEILNKLKQIRLKLSNEAEQGEFHFEFKGPASISSKNFAVEGQLEVFGEPFHVMELMKGANISLDVQVDFSRGYVPAEVNEKYVDIVGTIPLDAIYGPVRKVSYAIEPCRVGQRNDYDKLILEIWTDSTVCPEDVLGEAAKIAKEHFSIFINFNEKDYRGDDEDDAEDNAIKKLLDTSINTLDFTVRAKNCLDMAGIKTLGELAQKTEDEISSMRNVGKMTMTEIHAKLAEYNLRLGMTDFSHLKNTIKASRHKEETDEA
ncbi:DNA-directed RNA polymerase subunit alpha [Treponema pedis]|uniref:DNA-directed RNA polymerase subunit alpha n=2 Tax=Treponema pedis TaxID=409322 RepID=S6A255_9SPIR|nr:DNA-directed RNA polymerase subunit alpha [Treponema pedis]AGT45093.1 DNA-directed RNA polymerase subunit alpha [Treponema pedis str. T A4]QOW60354.1 DNA-directed RNA polymerase subunit alpha [Treponema pedis]QSI05694.1 DNA-directed RNA polymerase subunit alpha [Treponema pedis]